MIGEVNTGIVNLQERMVEQDSKVGLSGPREDRGAGPAYAGPCPREEGDRAVSPSLRQKGRKAFETSCETRSSLSPASGIVSGVRPFSGSAWTGYMNGAVRTGDSANAHLCTCMWSVSHADTEMVLYHALRKRLHSPVSDWGEQKSIQGVSRYVRCILPRSNHHSRVFFSPNSAAGMRHNATVSGLSCLAHALEDKKRLGGQ